MMPRNSNTGLLRTFVAISSDPRFEIDVDPKAVQRLVPPSKAERFEGIDFSPSGNTIAIATSDTNAVLLFRRKADGRFQDAPYQRIGGSSGLNYPHDVSFSRCGDSEFLAVAQRAGAIAIYEKNGADDNYSPEPVFEISGPKSKLAFSDGVAFVPPNNEYLAACNLQLATISFFRKASHSPIGFEGSPEYELRHPSIYNPDGLGFSRCGKWLAIANHGSQTVSVFQRRNKLMSGGQLSYGPEPVIVIEDRQFRYPHSVAFTPRTNHLIVTNAGANYFSVYEARRHYFGMQWSQSPVTQVIVHEDEAFREVNTANKMEGGPKGVAIHANTLAVCSSQIGVKIYSFREAF
jgi:DNA-binding beta-propeller fold protein YncE